MLQFTCDFDCLSRRMFATNTCSTIYALEFRMFSTLRFALIASAFSIGSAAFAAPDIALVGGLHHIQIGSGEGRIYASTDLRDVLISTTREMKLKIHNIGDQDLTFPSPISIGVGPTSANFTITQQPATTIAPGQSSPLTITYAPTAVGAHEAVVSIQSNDPNEGNFLFIVQGVGVTTVVSPQPNLSVTAGLPAVLKCSSKGTCKFSGSVNVVNNSNIPFNGGSWYLYKMQEKGFAGRYSTIVASGTLKKMKAYTGDPTLPIIKKVKYKASGLTPSDTKFALFIAPFDAGVDPDYSNNWIQVSAPALP